MTATAAPATGHYTVDGAAYVVEPAARGVRVLRVTPKGKTYQVGGARHDGTTYITANGTTRHHVETLLAAPAAHATKAIHHCTRCHAVLTDPESIARQLGPDCAAKVA